MINWFDMPEEGLSNGGQFEVKELEVTENGTYETKGEMYNKVVVNVEGGGGSSDFSTATVTIIDGRTPPTSGTVMAFRVSNLVVYDDEYGVSTVNGLPTYPSDSIPLNTILYKGKAVSYISFDGISQMPTLSGNITFSEEYEAFIITGDCTITIS